MSNGVLLCSHHHHVVHQLDLTIVRLGRAPTRGQMLGEPTRYRFARRGGRVVNAPPDAAAAPDAEVRPGRTTPATHAMLARA